MNNPPIVGVDCLSLMQTGDFGRVALDRLAEAAPQPGDPSAAQEHGQQEAQHAASDARSVIFPNAAPLRQRRARRGQMIEEPEEHDRQVDVGEMDAVTAPNRHGGINCRPTGRLQLASRVAS